MHQTRWPARHRNRRRSPAQAWTRACAMLTCTALAACAVQPARLGPSPGDYEAFVREVMGEAAKTPGAAPESATRAVRSAARLLGEGAVEANARD